MAAFATPAELADRLGVDAFTGDALTRATNLLAVASGAVQGAAGQSIELVEDDVATLRGSRESSIRLPGRPVVSVASVTLDGVDVDADGWYLDGDDLVRHCGRWGDPGLELVVTYTHGFDPVPDFVKGIVLEMVARIWVNPTGAVSERVGQVQVTYELQAAPSGLEVSDDLRRSLRRRLGRGSESLPIR